MRLHCGAAVDHERGRAEGPGFIDEKTQKGLNCAIFRIAILDLGGLGIYRKFALKVTWAKRAKGLGGLGPFSISHRL